MSTIPIDLGQTPNISYACHRLVWKGYAADMVVLFFQNGSWRLKPFEKETPSTIFLSGSWQWQEPQILTPITTYLNTQHVSCAELCRLFSYQ